MAKNYSVERCLQEIANAQNEEDAKIVRGVIKTSRLYQNQAVRAALSTCRRKELQSLANEAQFISEVECALLGEISKVSERFDWAGSELIHTILTVESLQRERIGAPHFPLFPSLLVEDGIDSNHYINEFDHWASLDHFIEYFSVVLKALIKRCKIQSVQPVLTAEAFVAAAGHMEIAGKWKIFHEFRSFWEIASAKVDTQTRSFDASESDSVKAFRISLSRLRAFRAARPLDLLRQDNTLLPRRHLGLSQRPPSPKSVSNYMASLHFFSSDLSESIHGVTLLEWLRAYHVLREKALEYLSLGTPRGPRQLLFEREATYFERLIAEKADVALKKAKTIIQHLTFSQTSKDVLDCPLIPMGADLALLPAVTAVIEPAYSLESLLHSIRTEKTHGLNFIGPGLEASVRASLETAGIHARKVKTAEADCDVAFVLDEVLFLCECKAKYIPSEHSQYAKLEQDLLSTHVRQHLKTCLYFTKRLHLIRNKLHLPQYWQPRSIVPLIISSVKLGRTVEAEGIIITDHHILHAYLHSNGAHTPTIANKSYSAEGLLEYINNPQVIREHSALLTRREMTIDICGRDFSFIDCETFGEVGFTLAP